MLVLVIGTPDSGKSEIAEELAVKLSGDEARFYVATMIPFGIEGIKRVEKHQLHRSGKGFVTVECPIKVHELSGKINEPQKSTVLLECMSNLIGNEMHEAYNAKLSVSELAEYIVGTVLKLAKTVHNTVVVSNRFPMEDAEYDDDTKRYVRITKTVNDLLKVKADKVIEL